MHTRKMRALKPVCGRKGTGIYRITPGLVTKNLYRLFSRGGVARPSEAVGSAVQPLKAWACHKYFTFLKRGGALGLCSYG